MQCIDPKYFDWITGPDTGVSSMTMMCLLLGRPAPRHGFDVPSDMSDVGRCLRMLAKFPELEARLHELPALMPKWTPWVDCWPDLKRRMPEVEKWWALSDAERKQAMKKKYASDPSKAAYEVCKSLGYIGYYFAGMRPQGSLNSWKGTRETRANNPLSNAA